jgi:REP element-mobilizing transposase RayT
MRTYDLGDVEVSKRNRLPHWQASHAIQFMTFGLADAIPRAVLDEIDQQCHAYVEFLRRTKGPLTKADEYVVARERRRFTERALDHGLGECLLRDPAIAAMVEHAIHYLDGWKYDLISWSVMTNHLHLLYGAKGFRDGEIVHSLKGFTGRELNLHLQRSGSVWASDYYDHAVRNSRELQRIVRYIMNNASAAGLHDRPFQGTIPERIQELL